MANATVLSTPDETVVEPELDEWVAARKGGFQLDELIERVQYEAGLDDEDMDELPSKERFSAHGLTWDVGKPAPNGLPWHVIAMFEGDQTDDTDSHLPGDVRVYLVPAKGVDADGRQVPFARYTLNRRDPSLTRDAMGLKVFVEELAYEWERLAIEAGVIEEEEEEEEEEEKEELEPLSSSTETLADAPQATST